MKDDIEKVFDKGYHAALSAQPEAIDMPQGQADGFAKPTADAFEAGEGYLGELYT